MVETSNSLEKLADGCAAHCNFCCVKCSSGESLLRVIARIQERRSALGGLCGICCYARIQLRPKRIWGEASQTVKKLKSWEFWGSFFENWEFVLQIPKEFWAFFWGICSTTLLEYGSKCPIKRHLAFESHQSRSISNQRVKFWNFDYTPLPPTKHVHRWTHVNSLLVLQILRFVHIWSQFPWRTNFAVNSCELTLVCSPVCVFLWGDDFYNHHIKFNAIRVQTQQVCWWWWWCDFQQSLQNLFVLLFGPVLLSCQGYWKVLSYVEG